MIAAFMLALSIEAAPKVSKVKFFDTVEACVAEAASLNQGKHYDFDDGALVKGTIYICSKVLLPT